MPFFIFMIMEALNQSDKFESIIADSRLISRDLSWIKFNYRVLDQARHIDRSVFDRMKFLAITASNLDEFFMIRVGSLYNYLDYGKERIDYSGLREKPFKKHLYEESQHFFHLQHQLFKEKLLPLFRQYGKITQSIEELEEQEQQEVKKYFNKTIFPMLTPMVYDSYHTFPILMNRLLIFGVVTQGLDRDQKKVTFIQIPQNLPRFYEIEQEDKVIFIPIEVIIKQYIHLLFRNITIHSINLFRVTRNGDFTLEESDDIDSNFLEEIKTKIKSRRTGRVVRMEVEEGYDKWMVRMLKSRWDIDNDNVFEVPNDSILDFTGLFQVASHDEFKDKAFKPRMHQLPLTFSEFGQEDIFEKLQQNDILLHHPYNSMEPVVELLERAAEDEKVLSIKITIYRLAKKSRIVAALQKAAENGKHVSVLFELKARFDEENNIREAEKLQEAGCFVIYGISNLKTHTKLMLIVRKESDKVTRYVHMSSGNYNENTARLYTDLGLLSSDEDYANDVSDFFNVITGHSLPTSYNYLITAPHSMREELVSKINREAENSRNGLPSRIVFKLNSLQDKASINALYEASGAGVQIDLIIRGICCLRPRREGLSENIRVISIVGDFLEHSRIYYFCNNNNPEIYVGSADMMVRSYERRLESLFLVKNAVIKQQMINILHFNLRDNVNAYEMEEDGSYAIKELDGQPPFNIHKEFFSLKLEDIYKARLGAE